MVISLGMTTPNDTTTVDGLGRAPVSQYRLFANVPQQHPTPRLLTCRAVQTVHMRKQYHFWPGEKGLDAWDVDRLIALSSGAEDCRAGKHRRS